MAKQGEIDYLQNLGQKGQWHALNKPFSDRHCGLYLTDLGTIMSLMPSPPAKLLDLGAGTGWTSVFFARRGYEVTGQDIAPDMVELANQNKERDKLDNLQFIVSDYEGLHYKEEFDAAVFYDCLHHCEDEESAMRSAYDALKPGGILITAEPGQGHSTSEKSKEAMRKFGVNEKDMPPWLIIEIGKRIGFQESKVFQRQLEPTELTSPSDWQNRSLRQRFRMLKAYLREDRTAPWRRSNFVVLTK